MFDSVVSEETSLIEDRPDKCETQRICNEVVYDCLEAFKLVLLIGLLRVK